MMPNFFLCRIGVIQRSAGGLRVRRSAYQACTSTSPDGEVFDFSGNRRDHGHIRTIICAPVGSPAWTSDPQHCGHGQCWAEKRCDAQEARTFDIALPRELPPELWDEAIRAMLAPFVEDGMVMQVDIHMTAALDLGANPHIHVIATLRRVEGDGFARRKARDWNAQFLGKAQKVRSEIAGRLNEFCRRHNIDYYADPRSNEARGLPEPEPTLPRWNILLAKRNGTPTAWVKENEEHRLARAQIAQLEEDLRETET